MQNICMGHGSHAFPSLFRDPSLEPLPVHWEMGSQIDGFGREGMNGGDGKSPLHNDWQPGFHHNFNVKLPAPPPHELQVLHFKFEPLTPYESTLVFKERGSIRSE